MKSYTKLIKITAFLLAPIFLNTGCISLSSVDAGVEGVMTYKPWIFGDGGVDADPIKAGAIWTVWSTSVTRYNVKPRKITEPFVDLTAKDNVAIDFNAYITFKLIEGLTPKLHEKSGSKWYTNKVKDVFRTAVRNEGRSYSSIDLRTNSVVLDNMQEKILSDMRAYVDKIELPVRVIKVVIGKVIPPDEVLAEAERTAAQKQREKTQTAKAKAELTRANAERNRALADKAFADQFNMTTAQFLENKKLDIMEKAVDTGKVTLIMNASEAKPIFNVGNKEQIAKVE